MSKDFASDETNESPCSALYALTSDIILRNARFCLRHSAYPELWNITCNFCGGVLTLQGVVGSYFLKQLAHTAVLGVAGVEEVANRLNVQYPMNPQNGRG
jgi:hypothetical protein